MRAPAILAGITAGVLLSLAGLALASPGMGSLSGGLPSSLPGNISVTGDVTVGDDVFIDQSDFVSFNGTTATANQLYNGTNHVFTVPASKGFSYVVDATEVAALSSAGALQLDAGISAGGAIATSSGNVTSTNGQLNARATAYGHTFFLQDQYGGATQAYVMTANPADGATAFNVNTQIQGGDNPLTSGNIMKWMNDDVDQATVDYGGRIQINMAGNAEPTCDSGRRGMLSITQSAAAAGDIVRACLKGTDDNYAWRSVFTAP